MNKKIKTVTETVGDMERFPCKKNKFYTSLFGPRKAQLKKASGICVV